AKAISENKNSINGTTASRLRMYQCIRSPWTADQIEVLVTAAGRSETCGRRAFSGGRCRLDAREKRPDGMPGSALEEERLRPGVTRRAQWPVVGDQVWHVDEVGVDDDDTLDHRREADGADAVELIGDQAVEFLGELDLLLGADGLGLFDDLDD